jgi:hypothetical protein
LDVKFSYFQHISINICNQDNFFGGKDEEYFDANNDEVFGPEETSLDEVSCLQIISAAVVATLGHATVGYQMNFHGTVRHG